MGCLEMTNTLRRLKVTVSRGNEHSGSYVRGRVLLHPSGCLNPMHVLGGGVGNCRNPEGKSKRNFLVTE